MSNQRTVEVEWDFYVRLLDYLLPEERWVPQDEDGPAIALYVLPSKRLTFKPRPAEEDVDER